MRKWSHVRASILIPARLSLAAVASLTAASSLAATHEAPKTPAVDPQAKEALTRMGEALKALPAFGLHQEITREQVIDGDLKVQKSTTADILVRRPDRMKADVVGDDDKSHALFYDGKTLTVFVPAKNYYAQAAAPNTIGATIDMAESNYGIDFPTPDLLRAASGEGFSEGLTAAGYVGKSRVGDDECDHYAYRSAEVDYQLWIETGDKALPRKFVITSKKDPAQPEYTAVNTWNLSPKVDDATFVFTPPEGATKIPMGALKPAHANKPQTTQPHK
jgi:hypothetical protein